MSPILESAVPVLASLDIPKTVEFWVGTLGFTSVYQEPGSYGIVQRDAVQIHFWNCNDKSIPALTSCRVGVKEIDGLYEEMRSQGVIHPNGTIQRQPWGMNEFTILDSDGNCVTFFEPAAAG